MRFKLLLIVFCIYSSYNSLISQSVLIKENQSTGFLELTNGLVGIAIPWKKAQAQKIYNLAPIQSIIYPGGIYSDNTINYLYTGVELTSIGVNPFDFKFQIIKQSAEEISINLEYRFQKPKFAYESNVYRNAEAGLGYYKINFTLRKNQKSIAITEDTNYDIYYSFKISNGLYPDKARYRGWSSSDLKYGYERPGQIYRSENERPYPMDATVDLSYSEKTNYPQLSLWDPAGAEQSTGRYWIIYNSTKPGSHYVGMFQGKPSKLIGARLSGPQLVTTQKDEKNSEINSAEIKVTMSRRTGDNMWFPRKRISWNLYVANSGEITLPEKDQSIAKEMNSQSSLGASVEAMASRSVIINPTFFQAAIYKSPSDIQLMISKTKSDYNYYLQLMSLDGDFRNIWDAWRFKDSVRPIIHRLINYKKSLIENYKTGDGTYRKDTRYWIGVRNFRITAFTIAGLYADKSISLSASEKNELNHLIGLMARILWHDDNVPVIDSAGVNLGTANMIFQYKIIGRYFFALILNKDPEFSSRAAAIKNEMLKEIERGIFDNGSSFGSPHYTQTGIDPIWMTMLQLKQAGIADHFTHPKVKKYAGFLTSLLTPASVRFNLNRKVVCFGDGSEESAGSFGLLATGLKNIDKSLSDRLLSIYHHGPPGYVFAGPAPMAIDFAAAPDKVSIPFTNANYTGYLSQFRFAANTHFESAAWMLNGEKFYDHRKDDKAEIAMYALGAPLSLSISSFYSPRIASAKMKSGLVPAFKFPEWASANQSMMNDPKYPSSWDISRQVDWTDLVSGTMSYVSMRNADSSRWDRKIYQLSLNDSTVIYAIYDSSSIECISTMPLVTEGSIHTPYGLVNAQKKSWDAYGTQETPISTPVRIINSGWNKFSFTGQTWKLHPTQGIDCDIHTYSKSTMENSFSEWATNWQNTNEANDFQKANGKPYWESQQYLRLKTKSALFTVIIPRLKGRPSMATVKYEGNKIIIRTAQESLEMDPGYCLIKRKETNSFIVWQNSALIPGFNVTGGSLEIIESPKDIKVIVSGKSGIRTIILPYKIIPSRMDPTVTITSTGASTKLIIKYTSGTLDQPLGTVNNQEYRFTKV